MGPSWRRAWQPTPVFLPGEFHGQRSLVGYSLWGHKESDMTEPLTHTHTHTHTQLREGEGRDRGPAGAYRENRQPAPGFQRSSNSILCLLDTPQTSILCRARASSESWKVRGEGPAFFPPSPFSICKAVQAHQKEEVHLQGPVMNPTEMDFPEPHYLSLPGSQVTSITSSHCLAQICCEAPSLFWEL